LCSIKKLPILQPKTTAKSAPHERYDKEPKIQGLGAGAGAGVVVHLGADATGTRSEKFRLRRKLVIQLDQFHDSEAESASIAASMCQS